MTLLPSFSDAAVAAVARVASVTVATGQGDGGAADALARSKQASALLSLLWAAPSPVQGLAARNLITFP
eukprot:CAMPEP_0194562920 /NCGR_PEP_ID=MMETSP0292-20121207/3180_1 /TAXON_ID=39354 /ORGANISM="Heterosigma akashiwo, Strain CCMP2393" /LENGTH=68 /DNA_ID=CAMNT_0039411741 /DNA_START=165 /DNA_END=370 /DNA_ORIENTATION=+